VDESNKQNVRYYFVDEAGDGTLFDRKGRVIIGNEGCSSFFILGLLDVLNPVLLERDMKTLREKLLSDPYFEGVPSMKPEAKKISLAFHAKDDLPEARRVSAPVSARLADIAVLLRSNSGYFGYHRTFENVFIKPNRDPLLQYLVYLYCIAKGEKSILRTDRGAKQR